MILIIFLNKNVYKEVLDRNKQYNLISISCKNDLVNEYNTIELCKNIFEYIFKNFYTIKLSEQKLNEFTERKITTHEEFEKGFFKSGKGYFNFYIYKSKDDSLKYNTFTDFIKENNKNNLIYLYQSNNDNEDLELVFQYSIFINAKFE